ncbi:protein lin-52 homolog isoform X3 [Macrosteles quadrilineatus]|uniref:protein lin-52 homolog isoform X3 n=1 Tax=Macrosteles quadrilineatus TaxID=74068 RepID=UPI0023E2C6D9|nr:protein lin-52 homolog isoform X3 [Macrosteles quadrilineatus]XP_054260972.1 protein lin-52 homolog isoform X3 [Macrosteles quadrilineatus]XP_054260973.1 protein lin-52 homolog isoform X3 [Macrosteles quadrilineatus]
MSTLDQSLLSLEKLDRSSPELWPESTQNNLPQPWNRPLDDEDKQLLRYYGTLSVTNLIAEVKHLHDIAYKLGLEEAKEMTRGKYLNILEKRRKKPL